MYGNYCRFGNGDILWAKRRDERCTVSTGGANEAYGFTYPNIGRSAKVDTGTDKGFAGKKMISIEILLLDDAEADREFLVGKLSENEQLSIREFYNGNEFRKAISDDTRLIITDVCVPGYDVFETIDYTHINFPGVYIIVISGHFDDYIYERLFEFGVDRVVKKGTNEMWINKVIKYVDQLLPKIIQKQNLL